MTSSWLARQALKAAEPVIDLLSSKKGKHALVSAAGVTVMETHLPKLARLGKTTRIRLVHVDEFEKDVFADVDMLRFIKLVIPISSINPLSLATDIFIRLIYTLDMMTDIRDDIDINKYLSFLTDATIEALASIAHEINLFTFDEPKRNAVFNLTFITPPDDIIWPDVMWATTSMHNITENPYYLSKELLDAYSDWHVEGSTLVINY